ncbi:MAG: DUF4365 domain-containing protein [Waterburya sp.]
MDTNTRKEEFSYGYLKTIGAKSGIAIENHGRSIDNQGIDIQAVYAGKLDNIHTPRIDAQVKCTSQDIEKEDYIHFPLETKAYELLINPFVYNPIILIVVLVPKNLNEWVNINNEQTVIKKCAYWISLKGKKPSTNKNIITVKISKNNIITPESFSNIIKQEAEKRRKQIIAEIKGGDKSNE